MTSIWLLGLVCQRGEAVVCRGSWEVVSLLTNIVTIAMAGLPIGPWSCRRSWRQK